MCIRDSVEPRLREHHSLAAQRAHLRAADVERVAQTRDVGQRDIGSHGGQAVAQARAVHEQPHAEVAAHLRERLELDERVHGAVPVSYTHLDVYKRQPQDDAAGGLVDECVPSATTSRCPKLAEGRLRVFLARDTWCFLVPFALFQMLLLGVLSFAPTAMQQRGVGVVESGFASTLPMLLAIVSSLAFGRLSDRFGRNKPLYLAGMLAMAPCTWLLLTTTGPVMCCLLYTSRCV